MYTDIESLIRDNDRFSLENLLNYTPQTWLSKRNQVIVKFIETLTNNTLNTDSLNSKKIYKRAMAVDLIYGSNDVQTTGPRTRPEIIAECQRFRTRLRKDSFLNPINLRIICDESSQLTNLTDLAKKSHQEYIIEVFYNNNPTPFFRPIPITK